MHIPLGCRLGVSRAKSKVRRGLFSRVLLSGVGRRVLEQYNAGIAATRALMQSQGGERDHGLSERDNNAAPPQTLGDYQYQYQQAHHHQHYTHSVEAARAMNSDDLARQHHATHAPPPPPQQQQPGHDWMLDYRSSGEHHEASSAATRGRCAHTHTHTHLRSQPVFGTLSLV